jgi:hypothetical protein
VPLGSRRLSPPPQEAPLPGGYAALPLRPCARVVRVRRSCGVYAVLVWCVCAVAMGGGGGGGQLLVAGRGGDW